MMDLQDYRLEMSGNQLPSEVTDYTAQNLIILQDFFFFADAFSYVHSAHSLISVEQN